MPPFGTSGGQPGRSHDYRIVAAGGSERILGVHVSGVPINPGDVVVCASAGGGGYGDPRDRDPETIRRDVIYGHVSSEAAESVYGLQENVGAAARAHASARAGGVVS
ncbi:N-methylhydantoinase B/oxoprolinase/acetone carboxylase alpha subunit [Bradyrhizobium sp. GM5.1]